VFAKEPEPGKVKTRLKSSCTDKELLELYRMFVMDMLDMARQVCCEKKIVAYLSKSEPRYLKSISEDFDLIKQRGRNLGERMHNAFLYSKKIKAAKTVIIGSDSPALPVKFIEKAFERLDEHDLVLGPSFDGGYYLIGMKKPCFGIFKDIQWSASSVLIETLTKAKVLRKKIALLDEWFDVDDCGGAILGAKTAMIEKK
jgi:hypothetical protein